jgi:cytoskeletal protein RodZ
MPTLGEELRRLREERNIPLAEISEATRIGTRFLKAIENDNFSVLPGGIFTRSFIRAYAKQVGMDEEDAVTLYQRQISGAGSGEPQEPSPPSHQQKPVPEKRQKTPPAVERTPSVTPPSIIPTTRRTASPVARTTAPPLNWSRALIALVILLFIGLVIVTLIRQLNAGSARTAEQTPNAGASNQTTPAVPTQTAKAGSSGPGSSTQMPDKPGAPPQSTTSSADDLDKLVVILEASSGDSWIRYQVDDASPTQMTLRQGQVQEIPAALNQIKLNYGNRETLKLTINNRRASFPPDAPKFGSQVIISKDTLQSFFQ